MWLILKHRFIIILSWVVGAAWFHVFSECWVWKGFCLSAFWIVRSGLMINYNCAVCCVVVDMMMIYVDMFASFSLASVIAYVNCSHYVYVNCRSR